MKDIQEYDGYKFSKGSVTKVTDPLCVETPLQLTINGESFTVVMHTPGHEIELAMGLLYAENVLEEFSKVKWEKVYDRYERIEELRLTVDKNLLKDGFLNSRSLLSVSSCGICGKKELKQLLPQEEALKQKVSCTFNQIFEMFEIMKTKQTSFNITGGCHGIAAFNSDRKLLYCREDIGRHNALDKVVGALIANKQLKQAKFLTFSGRTSYEMVSKAFRAKIPVLASVSAPSSLAIDFSKEYGLTLIAFSRETKGTCYSGVERIVV